MKKLPTGRQNFAALMKENLLYVDKTRQIYELIDSGNLYFLSRPRRFGKSLLLLEPIKTLSLIANYKL